MSNQVQQRSLFRSARSMLISVATGVATGVAAVAALTSISGCSQSPHVMSKQGVDYTLDCIRGVTYYRIGTRSLAVAMKPDGKPYSCSQNEK